MSAPSVLKFIAVVEAFFPRPKFAGASDSERIWLRVMQDTLAGFDDEVLTEAATLIVRSRNPKSDGTMFPKPSECREACERAAKDLAFRSAPLLPAPVEIDHWSEDRQALATDLCRGDLGRRAIAEGWISGLWHFARANARLPNADEAAKCRASVAAADEAIARICAEEIGDLSRAQLVTAIGDLAKGFQARRDDIRAKVTEVSP